MGLENHPRDVTLQSPNNIDQATRSSISELKYRAQPPLSITEGRKLPCHFSSHLAHQKLEALLSAARARSTSNSIPIIPLSLHSSDSLLGEAEAMCQLQSIPRDFQNPPAHACFADGFCTDVDRFAQVFRSLVDMGGGSRKNLFRQSQQRFQSWSTYKGFMPFKANGLQSQTMVQYNLLRENKPLGKVSLQKPEI